MSCILKIDNLYYKKILKNISLSLEENSFNVLIGGNGSGKTTLVKAISGLIEYSGDIFLLNELISKENIKEMRKNIGVCMMPLPSEGTVLDIIMYPLRNLNYNEKEAKEIVYKISKKLNIEDLLFKNINELTLSKKKMVCFASSVIHSPQLVIVDESFDELDYYYRNKIINYLKKMKKSTVLFITNNEEDYLLADNLIFIECGKIVKSGSLSEVVKDSKIFINCDAKIPFFVDLSQKLKLYDLIDDTILDSKEMVDAIWK